MQLPIVVWLEDGQVRVYDTTEAVLAELSASAIETDRCTFYDGEGHRLRYAIERVRRERRLFGIVPLSSEEVRLNLTDYTPPLDRTAELRKALDEYMSWPGWRIDRAWIKAATLDDLIAKARRILW